MKLTGPPGTIGVLKAMSNACRIHATPANARTRPRSVLTIRPKMLNTVVPLELSACGGIRLRTPSYTAAARAARRKAVSADAWTRSCGCGVQAAHDTQLHTWTLAAGCK